MVLQNILLPSLETSSDNHLYFHWDDRIRYSLKNNFVEIKENGYIGFDSYFNLFNIEKWSKYTKIKKLGITLRVKGSVKIDIFRKELVFGKITTEYLDEVIHNSEEAEKVTIPFSSASHNGMYGFCITALQKSAEFYGGYYYSDISENEINPVKIAIDICTFKREKFVEANLNVLNKNFLENENSPLYNNLEVFISDNSKTLDTDKLSSDKIHIFKNKNAGGAGGFTRGLIEIYRVKQEQNITHALLMDDDIRIEPEAVYRTFALLSCVKDEYKDAFIGGAMLRLDAQNIQVESGAVWNGGELISLKQGLNLDDLNNVLFNEIEETAQFNAWWYCAFPTSVISANNLPMPIFIRGDDVEYGLRNMKKLILLNGICVWHEPFENKYSSFLYYYILRNRLIDNSLHNMIMSKKEVKELLRRSVTEQLWLYRYKNADLLLDGVEDFLKGVNWLSEQDGENIHKSVMAKGYKLQPVDNFTEIPGFLYKRYRGSIDEKLKRSFVSRVVRRLTVNGHSLKSTRGFNIVPTVNATAESVYRTETVLNYDYCSRKGFVTSKDTKAAKQIKKRYKMICGLIDKKYNSVVEDYKNNYRDLTNLSFWNKYLGLE